MPRYLSDRSIRHHAEIAYHRAQALARNRRYCADLAKLTARGYAFDPDGSVRPDPWGEIGALARNIRQRARLRRLLLPDRLRALTTEEIEKDYADHPLFVGVPGWEVIRAPGPRPGARKVVIARDSDDPNPEPLVLWFVNRPVRVRGLRQRHRFTIYPETWRAYDLWQQWRSQRGRERRIIEEVWPGEWVPRPFGYDKARIHKRLYARLDLARALIRAAYPSNRSRARKLQA